MKIVQSSASDLLPTSKRRAIGLAIVSVFCLAVAAARADFNPIPLTAGSFNKDLVVEQSAPGPAQLLVTANFDAGTNTAGLTAGGGAGGNQGALHEVGFGSTGGVGAPFHGMTFNAMSNSTHSFIMPADYTQPNAVFVGGSGTVNPQVASGALAFVTPFHGDHLSILCTAGNGPCVVNYQVNYDDGTSDSGSISIGDWFATNTTSAPYIVGGTAWVCDGDFRGSDGTYQQVNVTPKQIRLFFSDIPITQTTPNATNVTFTYSSGGRAGIFGISGSTDSGGHYSPLGVTGFNYDMIIEAPLAKLVTATMDNGPLIQTNAPLRSWGDNNTFYEIGYNGFNGTNVFNAGTWWTGIPVHGSTFTAWSNANYSFTMPATYVGNCALFVGPYAAYGMSNGTLTLATAAIYTNLAILSTAGNGTTGLGVSNSYVIHHADSTTETGTFQSYDWFQASGSGGGNSSPTNKVAYIAAGRVPLGRNNGINNAGSLTSVKLFWADIPVANTASAVTSIDVAWLGSASHSGRSCIFALSGSDGTSAANMPIALNPSSYNADTVVEAQAITNVNSRLYTTASMDGGTNNNANTWYEQGWNPLEPLSGLPPAGSTITSTNLPDHHYVMPSTYTGPNAIYVESNNPVANITFASPTNYSAVSFLSANANGAVQIQVILNHAGGAPSETNVFNSKDWFNGVPAAFTAAGRLSSDNHSANNYIPVSTNPRFYEAQFGLADTVHNVTGATLIWTTNNGAGGQSGASSRVVVMAVSGSLGAVLPVITSITPTGLKQYDGSNILVTATVGGTAPIALQWMAGVQGSGTYTNLVDGGNTLGATSNQLAFTPVWWYNTADYVLVASNIVGSVTSAPVTYTFLSSLPDIPLTTDPIAAYQPNGGSSPAAETVNHAIDDLVGNDPGKYLNFGANGGVPYAGPTGFIVSSASGFNSVVSAMRLYTANDTVARDPADYVLEGSTDGGTTWNAISSGALALPAARNNAASAAVNALTQTLQEVHFSNIAAYTGYRWSVNNVKDNTTANSMQIGEVELLGYFTNTIPHFTCQPLNSTVITNDNATFCVSVLGAYPTNVSYQWYLNGTTLIPNATNACYTLPNVQGGDSGKMFSCTVTNPAGSITSVSAMLTVTSSKPSTPYASAVLADGPIAYLRLDESDNGSGNNGSIANDMVGGHSGVYSNTLLGVAGYRASDPDTSAMFGQTTANSSYVGCIGGIDFATPTNSASAFSVECWIKGTNGGGIICKGIGGGGEQFCLDCGAGGGAFRFFIRNAQGATEGGNANGTVVPDSNTWHHVVGVCDQPHSNLVLYVDGLTNAKATASAYSGILSTPHPMTIGSREQTANSGYNLQFSGNVDEVAIYPYALSAAQVSSHYLSAGVAPIILSPASQTNLTVAEGSTVTLTTVAYGSAPLSYQWWEDITPAPLAGKTSSSLTLNNIQPGQQGYGYYCVVTNIYGSAGDDSHAFIINQVVSGPPSLINDLASTQAVVYAGTPLVLEADFGGTPPISYQWVKDGAAMNDTSRVTGSHSNVLAIIPSLVADSGVYYLYASNAQGMATSSVVTVEVEVVADFNGNGAGWTKAPGSSVGAGQMGSVTNGVYVVTDGVNNTVSAFWYNSPIYVGGFSSYFTYQALPGTNGLADGTCFVIQNDPRGTTAIGGGGGQFAYAGGAGVVITPSVAFEINIYNGHARGYAFGINGSISYNAVADPNPASGDVIDVSMFYDGAVLSVTAFDETTLGTYTTSQAVNIPGTIGNNCGYVGITGACGGQDSVQSVSNFAYYPIPMLAATVSGNNIVLSWPNCVGGYVLQQETDLAAGTWADVSTPPTSVGGNLQVTVPNNGTQQFFRLRLFTQ